MEEGQNQTNYKIRFNKLAIGFIIIQVVFIVFLAISIPQLSRPDEVNDEDLSRIPVATISNFGKALMTPFLSILKPVICEKIV